MIVTPLDSAQLDSKEQYVFYHNMVEFAIKELIAAVQQQQLCNVQEMQLFKQYAELLSYSIEAMRVKYMYDDEDNMKIDLTDSGFPNYLEFRYLYNDLELREQFQQKLTDVNQLKREFLDTLLRRKQNINKRQLFEAASIVYYTSVEQKFIFNRYAQGKILKAIEGQAEYLVSWAFYDVSHNRPFICYMYFDYDGKDPKKERDAIYEALKQSGDRDMALDGMAYAIDKKLKNVHPKHVKRIDIGPLHNVFAKDENEFTHAILESIGKKEIPLESYAFSFTIDEIFSGNEFEEGGFFNKQKLQKWSTPFKQNYVFAPHRVIQLLYNKAPESMNKLAKPPIEVAKLDAVGSH